MIHDDFAITQEYVFKVSAGDAKRSHQQALAYSPVKVKKDGDLIIKTRL